MAHQYRLFLARTLVTLTIPQGYTLSIAGTFAVASQHYGSPFAPEAWGFVVGAVAAFGVLAVAVGSHIRGELIEVPRHVRAVFNVVPIASVLVGAAGVYLTPWAWVGFPVAGFASVTGYILLVSAFFTAVSHPRSG
ncbi:MAG: hypothetical protein ACYDA0_11555 [Candidatus Dormibacteraceae bacterium]